MRNAIVLAPLAAFMLAANFALTPLLESQKAALLGPSAPAAPPPEVAVPSVLLGAFRGLVVDYLWLRACRLEEDGKFYEAKDLAEWISTLEPRLDQVWSFQAHGLAYNLCAATDDAEGRWKWIEAGISLLRDKGIVLNPHAPELYFMLSRIYSDKIGGPFDDYHLYFKKRLAIELVHAFGPLTGDADLEGLANAPASLEKDAEATALLAELEKAGLDLEATEGAWDEALSRAPAARALAKEAKETSPEVLRRLRSHFRAAWARSLHLDPGKCLDVEQRYGPLDWHGCDAMSLYWAVEGVRAAETLGPSRATKESRRLERLAIDSVKHALRRGRLMLEPGGEVFFAPEPRLAARVLALYDGAVERARAAEKAGEVLALETEEDDDGHHHEGSHEDFSATGYRIGLEEGRADALTDCVIILAEYGREAESRHFYARLVADRPTGQSYEEFLNYVLTLEAKTEFGNQVSAYQIINGNWVRAWMALAHGDDQQALGRIALAERVHKEWKKLVDKHIAEGDLLAAQRLGTVDLPTIKENAFEEAKKRLGPAFKKRLDERKSALMGP